MGQLSSKHKGKMERHIKLTIRNKSKQTGLVRTMIKLEIQRDLYNFVCT